MNKNKIFKKKDLKSIKILENKEVIIEQFLGVEDAKQVIQDAFDLYDKNKDHLAGR